MILILNKSVDGGHRQIQLGVISGNSPENIAESIKMKITSAQEWELPLGGKAVSYYLEKDDGSKYSMDKYPEINQSSVIP